MTLDYDGVNDDLEEKGRLTSLRATDGEGGTLTVNPRYENDGTGRSSLRGPGIEATPLVYDGSVLSELIQAVGPAESPSIQIGYEPGSFTPASLTAGTSTLADLRDGDGLVAAVRDVDQQPLLTIERNHVLGLVTRTVSGEVTTEVTYNGFGEVSTYEAHFGYDLIYSYTITGRDKLGRITGKSETARPCGSGDPVIKEFTYTYDSLGRLETVEVMIDDVVVDRWEYSYDLNGNRTAVRHGQSYTATTYNEQDQLRETFPDLDEDGIRDQNEDQIAVYEYTRKGDLLSKTGAAAASYTYNALGSLTKVVQATETTRYLINGLGQRVVVQRGPDEQHLTMERGLVYLGGLSPIAETNDQGEITRHFAYAGESHAPSLMVEQGEFTYRILTDHLGSPRYVVYVDAAQLQDPIVQCLEYDPWGKVLNDSNPGFQPFGFAGGLYDHVTGLVRFGARDYDPETGRWMAKDPILFWGHDSNLYRYAADVPVHITDPNGL
ncbi:MAG: RHS repeat-associated core domain-containing protein, partial [Myxococcota bacterium]|nr:RHS repeat-associated core domain-containing protein [Myxococcota bacterium]